MGSCVAGVECGSEVKSKLITKEVRTSKNGMFNKMARSGCRSGGGSGSETMKP